MYAPSANRPKSTNRSSVAEQPQKTMDQSASEPSEPSDDFILSDRDQDEVIRPVRNLLWKIARSSLIDASALEAIAKLIRAFDELPKPPKLDIEVLLRGPERCFGEHQIYHYWTVRTESESGSLEVGAGGHFYRESTGGDSFTSLNWVVSPGNESQYDDFISSLGIVDDAAPFSYEIHCINLKNGDYHLEIDMNGETLLDSSEE